MTLEFAYMIREREPERNIFWLPALSMTAFKQGCADLVQKLGIQSIKNGDPREQLQQYLNSEEARRWLLILDNVDSEEDLLGQDGTPGIKTYLPQSQSGHGQLLLTTRWKKIAVEFAKTNVIPIAEMGEDDAKNLLQSSLITEFSCSSDETIKALLQLLAYLPLAIAQAAAYINIFEVSLEEYLQLCRHSQEDMMELLQSQYEDDTLYDESQGAVATTWLISFNQIQKQSPAASKLLLFVMCIEPQAIPKSILPDVGTEQERLKAIGTLKGYGFLKARSEQGMFDMHNLVHMVTQFWAKDRGMHAQNVADALTHLSSAFKPCVWETRSIWRPQLPHALHAFRTHEARHLTEWSTLGGQVGWCLLEEGRATEALHIFQLVLKALETTLAEDDPERLTIGRGLANAYFNKNQPREGNALLERIVKIRQETASEDDPDVLIAQYDLANGYALNHQYNEAIALLEYVIEMDKRRLPDDHINMLACYTSLAEAYGSDGQLEKSIPLLERVVKSYEKTLDEDHPTLLHAQHKLANVYHDIGYMDKAIALLEQVTRFRRVSFAKSHPGPLNSAMDLALLYLANDQYEQAASTLEYLMQRRRETHHDDGSSYLSLQYCLARSYAGVGRLDEAIALFEHVIKMCETLLAEDDPTQLGCQAALAVVYRANGQDEKGIALYEKVMKINERLFARGDLALLNDQGFIAMFNMFHETSDESEVSSEEAE